MLGNIYTDQKCLICGGSLIHNERRGGLFCKKHPEVQATGRFRVQIGRKIRPRFGTYIEASRYLTSVRHENDIGTFDVRDHLSSNPLGFDKLAKKYIAFKKNLKLKSFYHIECYINKAAEYFEGTNVKKIKKNHIRSFLDTLNVSDKTKANYNSQLHDMFYGYLYDEMEILNLDQLPRFPKIDYELGFRKLIGIEEREALINELKKQTYHINPKIWLYVDMLCSYNKFRPQDLRNVTEGDFDLEYGTITIWRPTKSKRKKNPPVIQERLLDFHIDEIRTLKKEYPAGPSMPFFRHNGKTQAKKDRPFGRNYIYKHWKKICKESGYDDLDLYGATRHSTTHAIAKAAGKDVAKKFSGHDTNRAFARYAQIGDEDSFSATQLMAKMRGKIVDIKKAKEE